MCMTTWDGCRCRAVERYEYRCPCRDGEIVEEHDNVPGFPEHDVWIDCDKRRAERRFVDGKSVRAWGLEPPWPRERRADWQTLTRRHSRDRREKQGGYADLSRSGGRIIRTFETPP